MQISNYLCSNLIQIWELGLGEKSDVILNDPQYATTISHFCKKLSVVLKETGVEQLEQTICEIAEEIFKANCAKNREIIKVSIRNFTQVIEKLNLKNLNDVANEVDKLADIIKPKDVDYWSNEFYIPEIGQLSIKGYPTSPANNPALQQASMFIPNSICLPPSLTSINELSKEALIFSYYLEMIRIATINYNPEILVNILIIINYGISLTKSDFARELDGFLSPMYAISDDEALAEMVEKIRTYSLKISDIFIALNKTKSNPTLKKIETFIQDLIIEQNYHSTFISEEDKNKALKLINPESTSTVSTLPNSQQAQKKPSPQPLMSVFGNNQLVEPKSTSSNLTLNLELMDEGTFTSALDDLIIKELSKEFGDISKERLDEIRLRILSAYDDQGYSFIHRAVMSFIRGKITIDKVEFLIKQEININQLTKKNFHSLTLLYIEIVEKRIFLSNHHFEILALFLNYGAFLPTPHCNYFLLKSILAIPNDFLFNIDKDISTATNFKFISSILESGALVEVNYFAENCDDDQEMQKFIQQLLFRVLKALRFPILAFGFQADGKKVTDPVALSKLIMSNHQLNSIIEELKQTNPKALKEFLSRTLLQVQRNLINYELRKQVKNTGNFPIYNQLIEAGTLLSENLSFYNKLESLDPSDSSFPVVAFGFQADKNDVADSINLEKTIKSPYELNFIIKVLRQINSKILKEFLLKNLQQVQDNINIYNSSDEIITKNSENTQTYNQLIEARTILYRNLELLNPISSSSLVRLSLIAASENISKNIEFKVTELSKPYIERTLNFAKSQLSNLELLIKGNNE